MQECAKICVKKCKRAKNWKIDFADVCIFFFWRQSYLTSFSSVTTRQSSSPLDSALAALSVADFCLFYVPPPSIGVTLVTLKQRHLRWLSVIYICGFYILYRKITLATYWYTMFLAMFLCVKISNFSICKEIVNCCISQHCTIRYKNWRYTINFPSWKM